MMAYLDELLHRALAGYEHQVDGNLTEKEAVYRWEAVREAAFYEFAECLKAGVVLSDNTLKTGGKLLYELLEEGKLKPKGLRKGPFKSTLNRDIAKYLAHRMKEIGRGPTDKLPTEIAGDASKRFHREISVIRKAWKKHKNYIFILLQND